MTKMPGRSVGASSARADIRVVSQVLIFLGGLAAGFLSLMWLIAYRHARFETALFAVAFYVVLSMYAAVMYSIVSSLGERREKDSRGDDS